MRVLSMADHLAAIAAERERKARADRLHAAIALIAPYRETDPAAGVEQGPWEVTATRSTRRPWTRA